MASTTSFTESVAVNYEKYMSPVFFEPYSKEIVNLIPVNSGKILELACGTGQVTRLATVKFPTAHITATDLNPAMIEVAKKFSGKLNNISWMQADAMNLPFGTDEFDCTICQFGLMFFPDKQVSFGEVHRVLKEGGKYILATWDKIENNYVNIVVKDSMNSYFPNDPINFFDIPFSMYDADELKRLYTHAGFKSIEVKNLKLDVRVESADIVAKGLLLGTPAYGFLVERNEKLIPEIIEMATKKLEEEFGKNDLVVEISAWFCEGIK